jgi:hypothetical protein
MEMMKHYGTISILTLFVSFLVVINAVLLSGNDPVTDFARLFSPIPDLPEPFSSERARAQVSTVTDVRPQSALDVCVTELQGDANQNGVVDNADLAIISTNLNKKGRNIPGDLNNDGAVNTEDFNIVVATFGQVRCPLSIEATE